MFLLKMVVWYSIEK